MELENKAKMSKQIKAVLSFFCLRIACVCPSTQKPVKKLIPSTCMPWSSNNLIDYGSGTGILAIAAVKLGANQALCVVNAPQVVLATRSNIRPHHQAIECCLPTTGKSKHACQIASHGNLFYTHLPKLCLSIRQKLLYQYYNTKPQTCVCSI
jgi:alpha-D-ribose 1-methylphosphonate 5-phosphate C-P lyase